MFHRLSRYCRPLAIRTCRNFSNRRNIPVMQIGAPWRRVRHFGDFLPSPFSRRNWIQEIERDMEDVFEQFHHMRNSEFSPFFNCGRSNGAQVIYNKNVFEVRLDAQHFKPEELEVKLADSRLQISAKHEQKADDYGFVKREFHREFEVPEDVNLESMKSTISEDGILTIRANVKAVEKQPDKVIEIKREESTKDGAAS